MRNSKTRGLTVLDQPFAVSTNLTQLHWELA